MMSRQQIAELQKLRARAWQKLAAMVPVAIAAMTERKAKLEARIDAGKKLSSSDQRELDEIRALLKRVDPEKIEAILRESATPNGGTR